MYIYYLILLAGRCAVAPGAQLRLQMDRGEALGRESDTSNDSSSSSSSSTTTTN